MVKLTFTLISSCVLISGFIISSVSAQSSTCDKKCVEVVKNLIEQQKNGLYVSWTEKDNRMLGDKIANGIRKVFPKEELYLVQNVRLYLPIIREAFADLNMIESIRDKKPIDSVYLLEDIENHITDKDSLHDIKILLKELLSITLNRDITVDASKALISNSKGFFVDINITNSSKNTVIFKTATLRLDFNDSSDKEEKYSMATIPLIQ